MADWELSQLAALAAPQQNVKFAVLDPNDIVTAPADSFGSDKVVTGAQVGALASADIPRVFTAGHSYASGYLNTENGEAWPDRLCGSLHAEDVRYALAGAVLARDNSAGQPGGYAAVLNALTPRVASGSTYTVRRAAPYLPLSPVTVFDYGVNDLAWLNATVATSVAWFKAALTAVTCIARAGGWFPDTDATVAYSAGWTANTTQQVWGWPTSHSTTTVSTTTVTITVPADFPGGEVCLYSLAKGGASGGGTKWSTVVDGGSAQVLDGTGSAFGSASGRTNLVVQRLTGPAGAPLAAGTHTIVATVAALDSTATAVFQGWSITATQLPVVILANQPAVPGLPLTVAGGPPHTPITSSDVTSLNTAIGQVAALFTDGAVIVADRATAAASAGGNVASGSPGSMYVSDGLHFNSSGHAMSAQVILGAIRSAPVPTRARFGPGGLVMRQLNGPLEPALSAGWSIVVQAWASGWFGKDRSGNTQLRATLVKSGAGVLGETVLTLPAGYPPAIQVIVPGFAWAAAYASVSNTGLISSEPTAVVQWFAGDPTTELDIYAAWPADGIGF